MNFASFLAEILPRKFRAPEGKRAVNLAKSVLIPASITAVVLALLIVPAFFLLTKPEIQASEARASGMLVSVSTKISPNLVVGPATVGSMRFALVIRQNGDLWLELDSPPTTGSTGKYGNARFRAFRVAILPVLTGFLRQ